MSKCTILVLQPLCRTQEHYVEAYNSFTGIVFMLFVILYRKLKIRVFPKGPEAANDQIEIFIRNCGSLAPKRYKYSEIKKMTNSFQEKLGQGGYGSVYKGQLSDGHLVAVKLLSEVTGNGEDFINEIASISRTSHVNVVTLLGTAGYMAPEVYFKSLGGASQKSDVYSYGMMIYKQVEIGGNLGDNGVTNDEEDKLSRKMMMVSLWCIQTDPSDRPSISKVVEMLEGSFESLQVPPRRFESSPARPFQGTFPSSMQSSSGDGISPVQEKISLPNPHEAS
ncbi:hypothetical protein M8C21_010724 [Ambrosia artemisiifolia]|uniref:Protein kinase domain-containing protein n=1 Tax=Ambrosia artemisiifolia TaxID=4212 RepID=A0AAD5CCF9_AMBAR|nr:hypothetical protein M8C21_010724 [Ambrosia artemisiifolia]